MQFYDLCPKVAHWLIALATKRLQDGVKERYQEEWMSHLQECNGKLGTLFHGFGCLRASFAMQMDFSKFVVRTKAYIFVLFVEWLVRLRIENSARKIIAAEKKWC